LWLLLFVAASAHMLEFVSMSEKELLLNHLDSLPLMMSKLKATSPKGNKQSRFHGMLLCWRSA
jgi:hypothetical protein